MMIKKATLVLLVIEILISRVYGSSPFDWFKRFKPRRRNLRMPSTRKILTYKLTSEKADLLTSGFVRQNYGDDYPSDLVSRIKDFGGLPDAQYDLAIGAPLLARKSRGDSALSLATIVKMYSNGIRVHFVGRPYGWEKDIVLVNDPERFQQEQVLPGHLMSETSSPGCLFEMKRMPNGDVSIFILKRKFRGPLEIDITKWWKPAHSRDVRGTIDTSKFKKGMSVYTFKYADLVSDKIYRLRVRIGFSNWDLDSAELGV
eukprot:242400_1